MSYLTAGLLRIDILEKVPVIFYGDLYRCFHLLLSNEKNRKFTI